MKKIKISLILFSAMLIFASGMLLTSCQKEDELTPNNLEKSVPTVELKTADETVNVQMQVRNNMLAFTTVEDYEKTLTYLTKIEDTNLEDWNNRFAFTSMQADYKAKKITEEKMQIKDNVLTSVLNTNATIEIQNKIFVLLPKTQQVLVYDNYKNYTDKSKARSYTFDDEVLTQEFGSEAEKAEIDKAPETDCDCKEKDVRGKYCKSYYPSTRKWDADCTPGGWAKYRTSYKKYGLYFTLKAHIWKDGYYSDAIRIELLSEGSWENSKGDGVFYEHKGGTSHQYTVRPYAKARRLKNYYIRTDYAMADHQCIPYQHVSQVWTKNCTK